MSDCMNDCKDLPKARRGRHIVEACRREWVLLSFIVLATTLRLVFWIYTDRIWEDALITLNPARNLWEGHGLTHHIPEPRVYSFTSALSVIVLIIGEGFGHAIAFDRIMSLVSAAFGIFFAARTLQHYRVGKLGQAVCLSFLATDHLQIFFGMSGMETQIATGIALGAVYAAALDKIRLFGVMAGLAALARPEFLLLDAVFFFYGIVRWRARFVVPAATAASIFLPWVAFTWAYYGSPIPNTIAVKSSIAGNPTGAMILAYALHYWRQFAPFEEFWFVDHVPGPSFFPGLVVLLVAVAGTLGIVYAGKNRFVPLIATAAVVAGFSAYMIRLNVNPYFMWYTPPFFALFFLLVGAGVQLVWSRMRVVAYALSTIIVMGYTIHLPFTLHLDREVQQHVELAVRDRVGLELAKLMEPGDSVSLEPLGYIGLRIRDREVFDYPGLGSKISAEAFSKYDLGLIAVLKPTFVVMRPSEIARVDRRFHGTLDDYETVDEVIGPTGDRVSYGGLSYKVMDNHFVVFRRKRPGERQNGDQVRS